MNTIEIRWWDDLVLIPVDRICLQEGLSQIWSSLDLIEVSWVNDVYLIHTSSLRLCEVMFFMLLSSEFSPVWNDSILELTKHEMGGGGTWCSRRGTFFPLWKAHIDFHSKANSVTSPLCHTVYFAPLIPWAGWLETSICWKGTELSEGIIY